MAIKKLTYTTNKYIPLATGCCSNVYICLDDECNDITADGNGLIVGTIQNSARRLKSTNATLFENPRCEDVYQYTLAYDDSQMALDLRGIPIVLTCDCIAEINPYYCTTRKLLSSQIEFAKVCFEPVTEAPTEDISPGCLISVIGHDSWQDGLYMYNGSAWVMISAYAAIP